MSAAYLCQLGELSRRYGVAAGNRIHKLVARQHLGESLMALTGLCAQGVFFRAKVITGALHARRF